MKFAAVIVAAGAGSRAGEGPPKQWRLLAGRPVVRWSTEALLAAGAERVVVVVPAGDEPMALERLKGLPHVVVAPGGAERIDSVKAGLAALSPDPPEAVLIHDAARPFVTSAHVSALLAALDGAAGALPALPVSD